MLGGWMWKKSAMVDKCYPRSRQDLDGDLQAPSLVGVGRGEKCFEPATL